MKTLIIIFTLFLSSAFGQLSFDNPVFYNNIKDDNINEISGIVKSQQHDIFWVHNDSEGESAVFGLDKDGNTVCKITIPFPNRDWEDISYGEIDGKFYIFIGEIGDNEKAFKTKSIYYFEEPKILQKEISLTSDKVKTITLELDIMTDCETLIFFPNNKNLYLISKGQVNENVYEIKYPYNTKETNKLSPIGKLPITNSNQNMINRIAGGNASFDGKYIAIKDYSTIFIFQVNNDINNIFSQTPFKLSSYKQSNEPQGEAVCWGTENYDIYTVGEEIFGIQSKIQYFKNTNTNSVKKKKN